MGSESVREVRARPCKFCKREVRMWVRQAPTRWFVCCDACGIIFGPEGSREETVAAWNRRW